MAQSWLLFAAALAFAVGFILGSNSFGAEISGAAVKGGTLASGAAKGDTIRLIVPASSPADKAKLVGKGCAIVRDLAIGGQNSSVVAICPKTVAGSIPNATEDRKLSFTVSKAFPKGSLPQGAKPQSLEANNFVGVSKFWDAGITGAGSIVAILDTGIDYNHPSLKDSIIASASFVDYTTDPMDDVGHGTHVAGIIASKGNPKIARCYRFECGELYCYYAEVPCSEDHDFSFGMPANESIGIAPDAKIMMAKVCHPWGCFESDIISGFEWAAKGVNITKQVDCSAKCGANKKCCAAAAGCALQNMSVLAGSSVACSYANKVPNPGSLKAGQALCPAKDGNRTQGSSVRCLLKDENGNILLDKNGCRYGQVYCPPDAASCTYEFSYASVVAQKCTGMTEQTTTVKPDVISVSLGGSPTYLFNSCDSSYPLVKEMQSVVQRKNIPVVVAAGNNGYGVSIPACSRWAVAVGATGDYYFDEGGFGFDYNHIAYYSGRGYAMYDHGVLAPGSFILSTVPKSDCWLCNPSGFEYLSGTSMATPMVAGFMALLKQKDPKLAGASLSSKLFASVTPAYIKGGYLFPETGFRRYEYGKGQITAQTIG
ncbi:MAG: S8 family serine peptidase [Candidatus Aenigmarchaeota archaeon]|nr:S8 family serine peptidase [Candidatus Aenigmarchaeota archaeon]